MTNAAKSLDKESKKDWLNQFANTVGHSTALEQAALRQMGLIRDLQGVDGIYKTHWHFVTGMGNPHPVENGFSWHPTLGVPYLSGATVKGIVRSWLEVWEPSENDIEKQQQLLTWFGSTDKNPTHPNYQSQTGALIFFDAIPVEPVSLGIDIMTPHMGKWYEQGQSITNLDEQATLIPADWHDPIPIPYLVTKQARFLFSIALRPRRNDTDQKIDLTLVKTALTNALDWLGAVQRRQWAMVN